MKMSNDIQSCEIMYKILRLIRIELKCKSFLNILGAQLSRLLSCIN